ncbi:MAG: cob(I)yrinic acid a,c-diamide adenosyltransferase [Clostridiales Family XIII bacterium]|jgi:cob(I)alamin adenosyltransferase|nr:cob(I)yrinic acid a,c-diamide adenosyltransferase [Clostridiales Family XIII bacterium]
MSGILTKGYIQIYTGDGKGKSTAAFGLAARMAGRGGRVFIGRFMKGLTSGEFISCDAIPGIEYEDFGSKEYIVGTPSSRDFSSAEHGLWRVGEVLESNEYDMVVMDEVNDALLFGLLTLDAVLETVAKRREHTELIMTGRGAPKELMDKADLVTEMRAVKHYFEKGIMARPGVEY